MKITDPRFDLIRRCHDGEASPAELAELEAHLREDPSFRNAYVRYIQMDLSLGRMAPQHSKPQTGPIQSAHLASSWRWIPAMAAGLVLGMFTTSLIFAFSERNPATPTQITKLGDGGFGERIGKVPSGFPPAFGLWSGDDSEFVRNDPQGGPPALRFVRAERESMLPSAGAGSCDVYQLIDLSALKSKASSGEATLSLSVQFRDARASEGETVRFIARIYLFSGAPDSIQAGWPLNRREALAIGSNQIDSRGGSPDSRSHVTAQVFLPPLADFALVHLIANKPDFRAPTNAQATFGEQFIEEVQLTLKTPLAPPPAISRR
ncbi:MAG: hypothetical protein RLZZ244_2187 [Verrucomicrobiota bacterium]|jgi:hypothetical protein